MCFLLTVSSLGYHLHFSVSRQKSLSRSSLLLPLHFLLPSLSLIFGLIQPRSNPFYCYDVRCLCTIEAWASWTWFLATSRNYLWRKIIILFCDTKCDGIGFSDELAEQSGNTRGWWNESASSLLFKRAVGRKRCHLDFWNGATSGEDYWWKTGTWIKAAEGTRVWGEVDLGQLPLKLSGRWYVKALWVGHTPAPVTCCLYVLNWFGSSCSLKHGIWVLRFSHPP